MAEAGSPVASSVGVRRQAWPLHPVLFAAVPVLALWVRNLSEGVSFNDVLPPLLVTVGATVVVMGAAALVLHRDLRRGALAAAALVFLVFSFGPLRDLLGDLTLAGVRLGSAAVVLPLSAVLLVAGVGWIARASSSRVASLTRGLNFVAAGLVAVNAAAIAVHELGARDVGVDATGVVAAAGRGSEPVGRPDIFFIVLDDYGGDRALSDLLGFDNGAFLDALEGRGFYVPEHPTTNYPHTSYYLASTLNLHYVQDLVPAGQALGEGVLRPLILDDAVPKFLKAKGYRYVHIGSWVKDTATNPQADTNVVLGRGLSEFSNALLGQTAFQPALEEFGSLDWDRQQYDRTLFQFDQVVKAGTVEGPTFVFAHILVPHWPYVFDDDGEFSDARVPVSAIKGPLDGVDPQIRVRYLRQLEFANHKTLEVIDRLLAGPPDSDPVIVLQSDEGFFTWLTGGPEAEDEELLQHFNNLSAFYLPRLERTGLYATITPVNTFRLLFDDYFDAGFGLLPDRNYVLASQDRRRRKTSESPL